MHQRSRKREHPFLKTYSKQGLLLLAGILVFSLSLISCGPSNPESESGAGDPTTTSESPQNTSSPSSSEASTNQIPDSELPEYKFRTITGKRMSLQEVQGKPLVINFWGTWCPPCVREIPHFQKMYEKKNGEFELIGFALRDTRKAVKEFRNKHDLTYPLALMETSDFQPFQRVMGGAVGLPTTLFINRKGTIVEKHTGFLAPQMFNRELKKILK